jgi:glutaredoxin
MPADPIPADGASPEASGASVAIVVYRRAGCAFCASLRRQLRRAGVATVERDIWADADAAAFVRRHAGGNETVPTVDVAGTILVNPTARQVMAVARAAGIAVPEPPRRWWQRRRTNAEGPG